MWSRPGDLSAISALLPLLLSHILVTLTFGSVTTFTQEHAKAVLEKHNDYRRQESAANMYEMHWNISLQQRADAWIQGCEFKHEQCHDAGENLFFSTSLQQEDIFLRGLKAWHDEISSWSYTSGNCMAACHYTQMVWAWTTTVGCSAKICPTLKASNRVFKDAMLFACYYYPRGNFLGHFPFSRGSPCSECAQGDSCSNDLCVSSGTESKSAPDVVKTLEPQTPIRHSLRVTALGGFQALVQSYMSQTRQRPPQSFTYRHETEDRKSRPETPRNMDANAGQKGHVTKNGLSELEKDRHPHPERDGKMKAAGDKRPKQVSYTHIEGSKRDELRHLDLMYLIMSTICSRKG